MSGMPTATAAMATHLKYPSHASPAIAGVSTDLSLRETWSNLGPQYYKIMVETLGTRPYDWHVL